MSNFLSVATVTETLRQMLDKALKTDITGASYQPEAKAVKPNSSSNEIPKLGVNIFLYQITPNASLRNFDLPTRRQDGTVMQMPRSAWELHYLLSFYGDETKLEPQRAMGSVVRTMHSHPVLTSKMIQDVKGTVNYLAESDLDGEPELVKFTPIQLSLEELSKIWSVFFQNSYTLSTAYQASVVFIDGKDKPGPSLPVRERNIFVMTFRNPVIESITPQFVKSGEEITIKGINLRSENIKVAFSSINAVPDTDKIKDNEIVLTLPAGLMAGINTAKIVHEVDFKTPNEPHKGFESNIGIFILRPAISNLASENVTSSTVNGSVYKSGDLKIDFTPKVSKEQKVVLMLNQLNQPSGKTPAAYNFDAPINNGITDPNINETSNIKIPFTGVVEGEYLVRVMVDSAESELNFDPATGLYNSPKINL
jgi:hypothetical protein